jgi:hypothetical protein
MGTPVGEMERGIAWHVPAEQPARGNGTLMDADFNADFR